MPKLKLQSWQRGQLKGMVRRPPSPQQLKRAQALLAVADGEPVAQVAERLQVTRQTIYGWITRFQQDPTWLRQQLADAPRPGRPAHKAVQLDRRVQAWLDSTPRQHGFPSSGWTNRLLRELALRELGLQVSAETMRQAIRRADYRWKRPRYRLRHRPPYWRQAKGGLKRGLKDRQRTVTLFSDAVFVTETPPLRYTYARIGQQAAVLISGNRAKRAVFGALNIRSGRLELHYWTHWDALCWQHFLLHIAAVWRGWHILLFVDRGSPHTAEESMGLAEDLGIDVRLLPTATPELNPLENLWREGKDEILANWPTRRIEEATEAFCHFLLALSPRQRLKKAGVLSGDFWLAA